MVGVARVYTMSDNPFAYGFQHKSLEQTKSECGKPTTYSRSLIDDDGHHQSLKALSGLELSSYYSGKALRCLLTVPFVLANLALQVVATIPLGLEFVCMQTEQWITKKKSLTDTNSYQIFYVRNLSLSRVLRFLANRSDERPDYRSEFEQTLSSLGIIDRKSSEPSIFLRHADYMRERAVASG